MAIDGHIMEPHPRVVHNAASIICGHDIIQALDEDTQAIFETFVREVLRGAMPQTYTEYCMNEKCPRGGLAVEVVRVLVGGMR